MTGAAPTHHAGPQVLNVLMMNSPGGPRKPDDSDHPLKEVMQTFAVNQMRWAGQHKHTRACMSARVLAPLCGVHKTGMDVRCHDRHYASAHTCPNSPQARSSSSRAPAMPLPSVRRARTHGTILLITGDADFIRPALWCKQQARKPTHGAGAVSAMF